MVRVNGIARHLKNTLCMHPYSAVLQLLLVPCAGSAEQLLGYFLTLRRVEAVTFEHVKAAKSTRETRSGKAPAASGCACAGQIRNTRKNCTCHDTGCRGSMHMRACTVAL